MSIYRDLFKGHQFAWYGQRALDCVGLDRFLDLAAVLCCDYGLDTPRLFPQDEGRIWSVEFATFRRENWTSAHLARILAQHGSSVLEHLRSRSSPLNVVAYAATGSLSALTKARGARVRAVMPDYRLKSRLDNKLRFARALRELGLPHVDSHVVRLDRLPFDRLSRDWGLPLVVQLPFGSSGTGTFFVSERRDLESIHARLGNVAVLVSRYVDGLSLNVNAAVLGEETVVAFPSIQLVGLGVCSRRREVYCGNDYSAAAGLPAAIVDRAQWCAHKVGSWLGRLGFQGMFGLDLVADLDTGTTYPVDLNPRFQNSTQLLTQSELSHARLPLVALNLAWQLGLIGQRDVRAWQSDLYVSKGAQAILHSLEGADAVCAGGLEPGGYRATATGVARAHDGISLLDSGGEGEVVISGAVPRPGTVVAPGAPLLKVFSWGTIFDVQARALLPAIARVCTSAYAGLNLQPIEHHRPAPVPARSGQD